MYKVTIIDVNGTNVDNYEIRSHQNSTQPDGLFGSEAEAIEELDHEVKLWEKAGGYVEQKSADRAYAFEPDGRLVSIIDVVKA
jgi:hypothetical protein